MERSNIEKIAHTPEDKLLLAKAWDKIQAGIRRNIPANTAFLSPREQDMCRFLFGEASGLSFFGGYEDAERKMLCYLPDYLEEDHLYTEDSPMVCLRSEFYEGDAPSHRDFLGALMGAGIARETVGDICVSVNSCDFFVTAEIRRIKCDADERRRRRLDGGDPLFSHAKMQTIPYGSLLIFCTTQ
jgi:RNA-binding protein YlmH